MSGGMNGDYLRRSSLRFDLSALVRRSVATLYSHLVTRPTGQALRLGIESQIGELGEVCLSVLDFGQVAVIDFSCADEIVAKLIRRFAADERPCDAYFIARGLGEFHRETVDYVLARQGLALVAETADARVELIGDVDDVGRQAFAALESARRARLDALSQALAAPRDDVHAVAERLVQQRVVLYDSSTREYVSLRALLEELG